MQSIHCPPRYISHSLEILLVEATQLLVRFDVFQQTTSMYLADHDGTVLWSLSVEMSGAEPPTSIALYMLA